MGKTQDDFKYVTFISYQRKDEEWARWFHQQLENYHLPTDNSFYDGKTELRPMFLDEAELSGGYLQNEIEEALNSSRFLLVLCSPNSAKSEWVNQEVQTFIDNGRLSYILPIIIDGSPYSNDLDIECFVPALKVLKGSEHERLGLNIKAGKEITLVKVVAHILGVSFDSLWNRYEKSKEQERIKLLKERRILQGLESRYLAEKGRDAIAKGNNILARKLALRALPKDIYNLEDRPFVDEASDMLFHSFQNNSVNAPQVFTEFVFDARFTKAGNELVTSGHGLDFWDMESWKVKYHIDCKEILSYICFSPDEKKIVGVSTYNVFVFDFVDKTLITRLNRGTCWTDCVAFSPDGKFLACIAFLTEIILLDAQTYTVVHRFSGHTESVSGFAFYPDGTKLYSVSFDKTLRVWDVVTGDCITVENRHRKINSITFNSNGGHMVLTYVDGYIEIYNFTPELSIREIKGHTGAVKSAQFSSDEKMLLTFSRDDKVIKFWDIESGGCIKQIAHDLCSYPMKTVALSPNNRYVISSDSIMKVTDLKGNDFANQRYKHIETNDFSVPNIAFDKDSEYLYYSSRQSYPNGILEYYKWNLENDVVEKCVIPIDNPVADNERQNFKSFVLAQEATNGMVESIELLAQEAMRGMVLGIYVACDGQYLLMDVIDDDMYLVEIASNTIVRKINVGEAKNRQIYTYCEYSQKLNIRVDRKLYTLNLKTLDCKYILNLEDYSLNSVDVYTNNDGYIYIMQNQLDENVKQNTDRLKVFVYDPESMKIINQFYCPKIDNVYRNVLTPDGRQILLGDSLLDIDTGNFVTKFATNTKKLKSPIFSPDGKTILSYSDNFVTFWDVRTGQSFYSITCEANCDFELIFSPNGSKCAFASRNGEICVWDFISPQALINHCRELYDGVDLTDDEKRSLYIES